MDGMKQTMTIKTIAILSFLMLLCVQIVAAQDSQVYTVKKGDTLYRIARQHGMTVDDLKRINGLESNNIQPGQELVVSGIPPQTPIDNTFPDPVFEPAVEKTPSEVSAGEETTVSEPRESASLNKPITRAKRSYRVRPGDTYYSVAIDHGVPAYAIFAMNGGNTDPLTPNETIWVPDTDPIASFDTSDQPRTYTVRKGDTLYGIARKAGTTVQRLKQVNNLGENNLRINQVITLPDPEPTPRPPRQQQLPPLYQTGPVVMYPETYTGRITASGVPYDPQRYTVSHPELALKTIVLLTNPQTGHTTFAEVTDRGPLDTKYMMDVSSIVARELRLTPGNDEPVHVRVIE